MSWTDMTELNQLVAWFDAADVAGNNGDPVGTWPKAGGIVTDLSASGSSRPTLIASAVNSLPAVDFDGTDDRMASGGFTMEQSPLAIAVVLHVDTTKSFNGIATIDDADSFAYVPSHLASFIYSDASIIHMEGTDYGGSQNNIRTVGSTVPSGSWGIVVTCVSVGQAAVLRRNGARMRVASLGNLGQWAAAPSDTVYLSVGDLPSLTSSELDGQIAELIIWSPTTFDEFEEVEGYLGHKYAIALPAEHPYYASPPTSAPNQGNGGYYNPFRNPVFGG